MGWAVPERAFIDNRPYQFDSRSLLCIGFTETLIEEVEKPPVEEVKKPPVEVAVAEGDVAGGGAVGSSGDDKHGGAGPG